MKRCACGGKNKCLDSRSNPDGNTRRRYECQLCGYKSYTLEIEIKKGLHAHADIISDDISISRIKEKIISLLDEI